MVDPHDREGILEAWESNFPRSRDAGERSLESKSEYVFSDCAGRVYPATLLDHLHKKLRDDLQLPKDCVLHSFRHTF